MVKEGSGYITSVKCTFCVVSFVNKKNDATFQSIDFINELRHCYKLLTSVEDKILMTRTILPNIF